MTAALYQLKKVVKTRHGKGVTFRLILPNLEIVEGEQLALVGESGCGKSTLLDMLALVLRPSETEQFQMTPPGESPVDVAAVWNRRNLNRLGRLRRKHVGYVLQTGGLLSFLTVRDNIALSRRLLKLSEEREEPVVETVARELGILDQLDKLPGDLSVGERQRVAIARAIAHHPAIVIADEPTASLDPVTAEKTMAILTRLVQERGITLILATHDWEHVDRLKLRRLQHSFHQERGGSVVESVFIDSDSDSDSAWRRVG